MRRDYLDEAFRILRGESMMLAQRAHLQALNYWYKSKIDGMIVELERINQTIKELSEK